MKPILLFSLIALLLAPARAAETPAGDGQAARRDQMLRAQAAKPYPGTGCWHDEDLALAAYWLNEHADTADAAILHEQEKEFSASLKGGDFHWHAYILERIYFLFARDSKHFPGRMSPAAEKALLEMLWQWAGPRCRLEMTQPGRDWWTWGSENHHAQAWSSFWGAAQIFARHPDYQNRRYADGTAPAAMAKGFTEYYKRFTRERAAKGLLVECNSGYNKYTLGGWYNIADFSDDPVLRRRMGMLLELFWADWACDQIDGVRGGSRHRCYPGTDSTAGSSMEGMIWYPFGLGKDGNKHPSVMCAATTFWRPSALVMELAHDAAGRGVYESVSRRPGLAQPRKEGDPIPNYATDPKHPFFVAQGLYPLAPEGGGLLRYTYSTPDFVIGTSMVEARPREDWTSISSQNRWEGVIFAGSPTARIFTQALTPKRGSIYNAQWSVQKRGVLIVQRLTASNAKGQRVWFDGGLRRVEKEGWIFAEAPRAFAAVRVVSGETNWEADSLDQHHAKKGSTDAGEWLNLKNAFAPVIIEVARKADCAGFEAFQRATLANPLKMEKGRLDYTSGLNKTTLTLFTDYSRPPLVDGTPVNYAPQRLYDSPFIQGDFGSGVVTIRKGEKKETLDFNNE